MADSLEFDLVVIGGGPGGYVAAIRASQLGKKVACIESRGALGGTCLNVGCIPSKALLESSEVYNKMANHAGSFGINVKSVEADVPAMIKRKNGIVAKFTKGIEGLFKKNKVQYFVGKGRFKTDHVVEVVDSGGAVTASLTAKNILIATGSVPINIPSFPFDGKTILSSTEALDLEKPPQKMVVIGGGVIGLEMGSVWARLGTEVSVIEAAPSILATMDASVKQSMTKILTAQGLKIHANTSVASVSVKGSKATVVAKDAEGKEIKFECDKVLVAVGRKAYTEGLGLEKIGVKTDERGRIEVDGHLASTVPHIYAVGDVIKGPMLAHKAEEEGVFVAETIAGGHAHVNYDAIPSIVYTWPEVASVGLTEDECKTRGLEYKVGQFPFIANGRAICHGETDGFVKFIADKRTDRILGCHMVGPNASELISEVVIAVEFKGSAEDIARSVHGHPTLSEAIKEAALAVDKRAIHI
jgi:dihydrolipoamide dehydrogenase